MAKYQLSYTSLVYIGIMTLALIPSVSVNAQSGLCNGDIVTPERIPLKGTGIDVKFDISQIKDQPTKYTVSFLKTGSDDVQTHIDYNFVLNDTQDREIFNAAAFAGQQSTLHTAEGIVSFSPTLNAGGYGTAIVTVSGVNFIPVEPQTASFPCIPVPEFPIGIVGIFAAVFASIVAITRYTKLES